MVFVAISAAMAGLVGLRWGFPHPYLWLAVALISSVQAPCAWLCFYRPQAGTAALSGRVGVALPFFSAIDMGAVLVWREVLELDRGLASGAVHGLRRRIAWAGLGHARAV